MNRKMKWFFVFFSLVGFFITMVSQPKISKAAHTVSYPASTLYYEIVDRKGNPFPIPLTIEGTYVKGTLNPESLISTTPASITNNGQNVFAFHMPAINHTVTGNETYAEFISRVKMTTPLPYLKEIGGFPNGSPLQKNTIHYMSTHNLYPTAVVPFQVPYLPSDWVKNADNTWNIRIWQNDLFTPIGGYWSFSGNFGTKTLDNTKSYFRGLDGDTYRIYLVFNQVKELFEDETGASIPAPTGYTDDNAVDITDQPFNYQMKNDSKLPKTYVDSGFIYTYKGWYKGVGNQSSIVTTYPPTIKFNPDLNEPKNEVHIVYNKKALRIVNEEYIDTSSATINSSWNNMGQQKADGDTFTQTPAATRTNAGVDWEYQGWKLGSEPMSSMRPKTTPVSVLIDANKTIQYVYKRKTHSITEKWVDQADGSTLIPIANNPRGWSTYDNDNFTRSPSATLTDTNGVIWDYVGWENVTDAPGIVNPKITPITISNVKGPKEVRCHYQARSTTATLDLNPTPQVTDSGGTVNWSSRLINTGSSALNNLKLKATSNWATGLSTPTKVTVTPAGGAPQDFTISSSDWVSGFNLTGINVPNTGPNNYADITFTTTATGAVNQVLPAEIEVDGNIPTPLKAENFVRIDDPDEPNLKPSGNSGLLNIPNFKFGDVEVKPFAQTKKLDASLYQAGYQPYIRMMDNESNFGWELTVKLGQFTSGSKTLPTSTSITLRNGKLMEVQNYNKHNESFSFVGLEGTKVLPSDGTTVSLTDHTAKGVYQLEYDLSNDVELDLVAHSGIAGLSYTADMDWTLTTAP